MPQPLRVDPALFDRMVRAGVFADGPRVELREGTIVEMNAQYVPHAAAKNSLAYAMRDALLIREPGYRVEIEVTVAIGDNRPTPDIIVWRPCKLDGPVPIEAVQLIVEVSVTTLADDLGFKALLYAGAGVPEYWVVDVGAHYVHCHSKPIDGVYQRRLVLKFGEFLLSETISGLRVDTSVLTE